MNFFWGGKWNLTPPQKIHRNQAEWFTLRIELTKIFSQKFLKDYSANIKYVIVTGYTKLNIFV